MPSFARELEQTLHNALGEASKRRHEYATLEHLLMALVDDEHASQGDDRLRGQPRRIEGDGQAISRQRAWRSGRRQRDRPDPDQRLPAGRPARHPPRPVVGPRRRHRRQRAGRPVLRARELCGLFPPAAGHEPAGCGDLHQPRRRQGRRRAPSRAKSAAPRRRPRQKRAARRKARSSSSPSTSTTRPRRARSIR